MIIIIMQYKEIGEKRILQYKREYLYSVDCTTLILVDSSVLDSIVPGQINETLP